MSTKKKFAIKWLDGLARLLFFSQNGLWAHKIWDKINLFNSRVVFFCAEDQSEIKSLIYTVILLCNVIHNFL